MLNRDSNNQQKYGTFSTERDTASRRPGFWKVISIGFLFLSSAGLLLISRKTAQTKVQLVEAMTDKETLQAGKKAQIENDVPDSISYIRQCLQNGTSNVCQMPEMEALCEDNLRIPRKEMPQLSHHVAKKYYAAKKKNGFQVKPHVVSVDQLTMVQDELMAENILKMYDSYKKGEFDPCKQVIPVSIHHHKKYIIDGHHRAMTCFFTGGKQQVMAISDSVKHILHDLKHFKGVTYSTAIFKPPKKAESKDKKPHGTESEMTKSYFVNKPA